MAVHYPADYEVFALVCIDDVECTPVDKSIVQYVNDKLGDRYIQQYGEFIATAEDDKTLYAMRDLEQFIGREITWVRGDSFDTIINRKHERVLLGNKHRLPSWARRYCTEQMKIQPIFEWWFQNVGQKVQMRIGFRFDEFYRVENFYNSNPTVYRSPVSCSTVGTKRQKLEDFVWRTISLPLVQKGVTNELVCSYWDNNGIIDNGLFGQYKIEFPEISNCIGCFHKKPETLAYQFGVHPSKMNWFAKQETKGMGTWLDSRVTYQSIGIHAEKNPFLLEMQKVATSCDSGSCTD